uniref:Helicase ATP-binding domain-containing protein n=1 Tax=Timema cristinae TaxID=61476 RepID=A0A7R9CS27_TIMCR|nr:unnamed protein product [Timema cristinae]
MLPSMEGCVDYPSSALPTLAATTDLDGSVGPRNVSARVRILPEVVLPHSLNEIRLASLDRHQSGPGQKRSCFMKRNAMLTQWPSWVHAQFEASRLVKLVTNQLEHLKPVKPSTYEEARPTSVVKSSKRNENESLWSAFDENCSLVLNPRRVPYILTTRHEQGGEKTQTDEFLLSATRVAVVQELPAPISIFSLSPQLNWRVLCHLIREMLSLTSLRGFWLEPNIPQADDPCIWWCTNRHRFNLLTPLARHYMAVIATQVANERLFSTAGNIISLRQENILPEHAEQLACIKRNLKRSILNDIESEDWLCFICDSKPLWELRSFCWAAQAFVNKEKKRIKHDRQEKLLELERKHKSPKERRLLRRGKSNDSPVSDSETSFVSTSRDRLWRSDRNSHNKRKHDNSTSSDSKDITAKNIKKYKSFDTQDQKTTRKREENEDDALSLRAKGTKERIIKSSKYKDSSSDNEDDVPSPRSKRTKERIIKSSKYKESSSDNEDDALSSRSKRIKEKIIKLSKYKESSSDNEDDAPSSRPKRTKELVKSSRYKENSSDSEEDAPSPRPKRIKEKIIKLSKYKVSSDNEDDVSSPRPKRTNEKIMKSSKYKESSSDNEDDAPLSRPKRTRVKIVKLSKYKENSSDNEDVSPSSRPKRTKELIKSIKYKESSSDKDDDALSSRPKRTRELIKSSKYKDSSSANEDDAPSLRPKRTKEKLIKSSKYKEISSDNEDDVLSSRPKRTKELTKPSKYKESSSVKEDDASTSRLKRTKGKISKYKENSSDNEDVPSPRPKRTKEKLIKSSKYLEISLENENDSSFSKSNRASKNPFKSTKNKESHSDSSTDETTKKQKKSSVYRERNSDREDKRFSVKKKGESGKKLLTSKTSDSITEEIKTTSKNDKRKLKGDGDATSECEGEDLPKLADEKSAQKAIIWLSENCSNIVDLGTLVAGRINKLKENKVKLKTTMKPQKVAHLVNGLRSFLNVFKEDIDNVEALLDLNHEHWQKIVSIRERKKRKNRSRNKDDDNNINEIAFQDSFKSAEANYNDVGVSSENFNDTNQEQDIVTNKDSPANVEQEMKSKHEKFENSELNSTKLDKCSSKMITNEPSSSDAEDDTSKPKKKTDIEETTQKSSDKELIKVVREEHDLNESINDSDEELLSNKANMISNKVKQFKNKNDKLATSDDESNSFESHSDNFTENNKSIEKFKKKGVLDKEKSCERSTSIRSNTTQDDDPSNETTDNLLKTSIPKQINEVESIKTQLHNASQDMFSDDDVDWQSNGRSNILKCIEQSEDVFEHTEYDSNAKHLYPKDKETQKSDNTIRTSTLLRNDSTLTQPNIMEDNESFKEKEIDDADKESISESVSTIEILNKSVDDSIFNETTQSIEDTNFLKIIDSETLEKDTEVGNSEYADEQAENSDCDDPLAIESPASDDEAFMGNVDSIISNKNENIVLDDNEKMKVNEHLFTDSLREDDTLANVQNNQMKERDLTEEASLKELPSHNENTENLTKEAETVKTVLLREFSSDAEIIGNNIDKDADKTAKHSDDEIVYDHSKEGEKAKSDLLKALLSDDETVENDLDRCTKKLKTVNVLCKEAEKAKADLSKDVLNNDETVEDDLGKCTEKAKTVNNLDKEADKAKAELSKELLNDDATVEDTLDKCTEKEKTVYDVGKEAENAKEDLLKDVLSDDETLEGGLDKCTEKVKTIDDLGKEAEKAKTFLLKDVLSDDEMVGNDIGKCAEKAKNVNDITKEAGKATATFNDTLSIGDITVEKDLSIEAEKAKAAILNDSSSDDDAIGNYLTKEAEKSKAALLKDSSSDDETLANYLSIEAEKAKTAMLEESSDDEKVKNDIIKEAETVKALLLACSSDETSDTNEHNNLKNRIDSAKKTKLIQNCPTEGRIRPKIGPKSRVKKVSECDVELYVTDSEDSSGNTKTKKYIRKNKFKIEETEAYKNDIKLGWKFEVTIERLPDTEFKKYYSNYVEIDETTGEEIMKDTKSTDKNNLSSLLNLNSLKRPRKQNEGSSGSDCSVKTNKKKPKEEKIKKVKGTAEDAASDLDDDSLESDDELKMLELRIEKRKSFLSKNEVAKRMLLALDSENENDSKEEAEEEEEDESKKKSKQKTDKLNSEKDIKKNKETNDLSESESKEKEKKDWRRNKLLIGRLSETDSSDEEKRWSRKKKKEEEIKADNDKLKKTKRRVLGSDSDDVKVVSEDSSDSIFEVKTKTKGKKKSDSEKSIRSSSDSDSSHGKKKQKRRRIKAPISDSSDSEGNLDASQRSGDTPGKGRKNIRRMMKDESVGEATRRAAREEEERKKRIIDKQKMYNELYNIPVGIEKLDKLVLDFDLETKEELVSVHPKLVQKLKPHQGCFSYIDCHLQAQGVKFMWDACFESVKQMKKSKGSGCILAHCMGLGKTFQVVTLVHTLLEHKVTNVNSVLIVCPLSTVLNWVAEFNMWLKDTGTEVNVFELSRCRKNYERVYRLKEWQEDGGVMVIGYDMFRNLVTANTKKLRKKALDIVKSTLLDPDHCMVQFVKPRLLGTSKEFKNRFVNPIVNGQFEDSTANDVKVMKRRAHVLHKMLEGSVQRFDYAVLTPFLPPKQEYVIFIRLTDVQIKIYRHYLDFYSQCSDEASKSKGARLFSDFQNLQRIWTHPRVMMLNAEKNEKIAETKRLMESDSEGSLKDFIDDSNSDSSSSEEDKKTTPSEDSDIVCMEDELTKSRENVPKKSTRRTRNNAGVNSDADESKPQEENVEEETKSTQWWSQFVKEDSFTSIHESGKLMLLFSILRECEKIGDKLLLFSQSLSSLNLVEYFLGRIDEATQNNSTDETLAFHTGTWVQGLDYFRLDGSTSGENRNHYCKAFNNEDNHRLKHAIIKMNKAKKVKGIEEQKRNEGLIAKNEEKMEEVEQEYRDN